MTNMKMTDMKRVIIGFLPLSLFTLMFGLERCAYSDLSLAGFGSSSIASPQFDVGPPSSGEKAGFGFDQSGGDTSLSTCTMNPMSSQSNEEALLTPPSFEMPEQYVAYNGSNPVSDPTPPTTATVPPTSPITPPVTPLITPPITPPVTPEPATAIFFILGIFVIGGVFALKIAKRVKPKLAT